LADPRKGKSGQAPIMVLVRGLPSSQAAETARKNVKGWRLMKISPCPLPRLQKLPERMLKVGGS